MNLKLLFVALLTLAIISSCQDDSEPKEIIAPEITSLRVSHVKNMPVTYTDGTVVTEYIYNLKVIVESFQAATYNMSIDLGGGIFYSKATLDYYLSGKTYGGDFYYTSPGTYTVTVVASEAGKSVTKKLTVKVD